MNNNSKFVSQAWTAVAASAQTRVVRAARRPATRSATRCPHWCTTTRQCRGWPTWRRLYGHPTLNWRRRCSRRCYRIYSKVYRYEEYCNIEIYLYEHACPRKGEPMIWRQQETVGFKGTGPVVMAQIKKGLYRLVELKRLIWSLFITMQWVNVYL